MAIQKYTKLVEALVMQPLGTELVIPKDSLTAEAQSIQRGIYKELRSIEKLLRLPQHRLEFLDAIDSYKVSLHDKPTIAFTILQSNEHEQRS